VSKFWESFKSVENLSRVGYSISKETMRAEHIDQEMRDSYFKGGAIMIKKIGVFTFLLVFVLFLQPFWLSAQESKDIKLLKPDTEGGRPLMQTLKERKSSREFSTEKLPLQVLSNLLWAADGVNRPDSGKRTAPSAMNCQNIDIYVVMADGLYLYDALEHTLKVILQEDIRAAMGKQESARDVPVYLIYVADFSKITRGTAEEKNFYSAAHTGFISQNVYLFCASEGLATVVRGGIDREALAKVMKLRPDQKIILAQPVGYPKKH
jgi:SagB-type dehydrogenase family enzyme